MPFTIVGKPAFSDPSMRPGAGFGMVTPDFFKTFGIHLENGRTFNEQDTASSVKVAVVNEEFVKEFLKGTDPLQQRISVEQLIPGVTKLGPPVDWQIVGVYHDVRAGGLRLEVFDAEAWVLWVRASDKAERHIGQQRGDEHAPKGDGHEVFPL